MTGIILLAAGSSSRLGEPKQLVDWHGQPLLRHMASVAIGAGLGPVTVVLGANDEACREALGDLQLTTIHNPNWASGMGSSISSGLLSLIVQATDGVIVMLCDQPLVDAELLRSLKELSEDYYVVASRYDEQLGPPAFFSPEQYDSLLALDGAEGAKSIINAETSVGWVEAPQAAVDIDTPEDLRAVGLAE